MKTLRLIGLAAGLGLACAGSAAAQDITIGIAGPMTGQYATFGQQFKNGATLAVADINAAGGVLGKKLKMDIEDDACDPKQARSVAEKLVGRNVPVVIGHFCSGSSIPASDVYADAGVLEITPASTNPKFTERGMWNLFRVCGRDDQQGARRRQLHPAALQGQERRHRARQADLQPGSRRRGQEDDQRRRHEGEDVRRPSARTTRTSTRWSRA